MQDSETGFTYYALSIKGGYYCGTEIVKDLANAQLFRTPELAIQFREHYDPLHKVDCSTLLRVNILVSEVHPE